MKKIINLFVFVGLVAILATYSSCGPKPAPELPITDQQLQKLIPSATSGTSASATWKLSSATLDGVDKIQAGDYAAGTFTIGLTGTLGATPAKFTYTTSKPTAPTSPWAQSGSFTFDTTTPGSIVNRDDGLIVTYTVNDTQLSLSFKYSGNGINRTAGRTQVVQGQWAFVFTK